MRKSAKKIVGHFRHSSTSMADLHLEQEAAKARKKVIIADVSTRWNSTHMMLQRMVEQKMHISTVLSQHNDQKVRELNPSYEDWQFFEQACQILDPFAAATKMLEGDLYPTLSLVSLVFATILRKLSRIEQKPLHNLSKRMIHILNHSVVERMKTIVKGITTVTTALDPRTKNLEMCSEETWRLVFQLAVDCGNLLNVTPSMPPQPLPVPQDTETTFLDDMQAFTEAVPQHPLPCIEEKVSCEIGEYKKQATLPLKVGDAYSDVFVWWREHKSKFPILAVLAQQVDQNKMHITHLHRRYVYRSISIFFSISVSQQVLHLRNGLPRPREIS